MRIVFDTNVLFAAFVARTGLCAKIVEASIVAHEVILSDFILSELTRHLRGKAKLDDSLIENAVESLTSSCRVVEPAPVSAGELRDANDLAILGTAIAARADVLVSGDKDLLSLGSFQSMPILSPRQFFDGYLSES